MANLPLSTPTIHTPARVGRPNVWTFEVTGDCMWWAVWASKPGEPAVLVTVRFSHTGAPFFRVGCHETPAALGKAALNAVRRAFQAKWIACPGPAARNTVHLITCSGAVTRNPGGL